MITPLLSKLHGYTGCRLRRRIIASLSSFEKVRKKPASIPKISLSTCFGKYIETGKHVHLKKYQDLVLYACCGQMSWYKNGDHRQCCEKINLCNDIETNPGPPMNNIEQTLTVKAPHSQGDITVFDANARQQCVPMSVCVISK